MYSCQQLCTPCLRSQWVYADTWVSAWSTPTPKLCPRSQWLIQHVCQRSQRLRWHTFVANIFAKTKIFAKLFLPVHMGPRWSLSIKKVSKISWHSHFNLSFSSRYNQRLWTKLFFFVWIKGCFYSNKSTNFQSCLFLHVSLLNLLVLSCLYCSL